VNSRLRAPHSTGLLVASSLCRPPSTACRQHEIHFQSVSISRTAGNGFHGSFTRQAATCSCTCTTTYTASCRPRCFLQTKQFQPKLTVLYLARDARCICITFDGWPRFAWPTQIRTQMFPVVMRARAALGRRDGMNLRGGESAASQACRRGGRHRRPRRRRRSPATAPTHGRRSTRVTATQLCAPAPTATPGPSTALLPATSDWSGPRCDEAPSPVGACIL